jgi:hypothetical protein
MKEWTCTSPPHHYRQKLSKIQENICRIVSLLTTGFSHNFANIITGSILSPAIASNGKELLFAVIILFSGEDNPNVRPQKTAPRTFRWDPL